MASRSACLLVGLLMFAVLMGQGAVPTAAAISGAGWQVVLAAGDDAEPVFDNATRELGQRLAAAGVSASNIHRLSANAAELSPDVEPAQAQVLLRRRADPPARMGDRGLVFLTSHGVRGAGLWLAPADTPLTPGDPARAPPPA